MTERRKLERERQRNIAVGLTSLAGLAGLVVLLMAFGYVPVLFRTGYTVTLYMENVAGLHENSRVTLWGGDIGEVREVGFARPGDPDRAFVKMMIDKQFKVPSDVQVRVETPLFGGGPVVAMVGSAADAKPLAMDGTAVLTSARVVDPLIQLEEVSEQLSAVGTNLNTLFGDPNDEGKPSLARVVLGIEDRLEQLDKVFAGADQWLNNEKLREDVTQTATNARDLTESLSESVTSLEKRYIALAEAAESRLGKVDGTLETAIKTLDGAAQSIAEIETRYVALADEAAQVVSVIDGLVKRADTKDSTIGLLLSDPQLYRNLTDTSERLKLMTDEARLLIEKWKAEGIPLRLFD